MINTIRDYFYLLGFAAKHTYFVWFCIVDGFIWGIYRSFTTVVFMKFLFDRIENGRPFKDILLLSSAMGIYMLVIYVFHEIFFNLIKPLTVQQLHEKMHTKLFNKAKDIDIECYDDPEFYNEYIWVLNDFEKEIIDVALDISKFINRMLSSFVIVTLIADIDKTVVLAVVISVVASVVLKYEKEKVAYKKKEALKPAERVSSYVSRVYYLGEYAQEIRMSNASELLLRDFDKSIDEQITISNKYGSKLLCIGMFRDFCSSVLINVGIITLLVYKIMIEKTISLGDFAASISGTWTLFWQLNNLLDYFTKMKGHSIYAGKLKNFLQYENKIKDLKITTPVPSFSRFEIQNVSFCYPGCTQPVLKNINFSINKGDKVAIVGYNGAGKSTLIKLLLRLYDPTKGNILQNGKNIRCFNCKEYRGQFGTVFQDFQVFALKISENIKAGIVEDGDKEIIDECIINSGLHKKILEFAQGIDSDITNEFSKDGVNLSVGEKQKLAIARAFMKNADILILDEPSSSLDPISEYELNKTLANLSKSKTVIFISHRLSTTIMADKIYMFEDGSIIEEGTHKELMNNNGKYAEMFNAQSTKYST